MVACAGDAAAGPGPDAGGAAGTIPDFILDDPGFAEELEERVNAYSRADHRGYDRPWLKNGFHEMVRESALPIFVSEFGVRARIEDWSSSGGATAFVPPADPEREQELRGEYYAWDMAQFSSFRAVVGASFHRWADRYLPDEQMNMGVVHRDGARWSAFDDRIRRWNLGTYSRLERLTGW